MHNPFRSMLIRAMLPGLFILITLTAGAQIKSTIGRNPGGMKSDQVTDEQLQKGFQQALDAGMTPDEIEAMAKAKGMDPAEIKKLKARMENLSIAKSRSGSPRSAEKMGFSNKQVDYPESFEDRLSNSLPLFVSRNFGFSLFTNNNLTFEPGINVATPKNYQLGPDDNLTIDIWGASEANYEQTITADGNIIITSLGPIFLNGFTIEEATRKIKKEMTRIYSGLAQGNTFIKVSLSDIRSIKVNIVGDVALPGTYNISSLASVFNAMYAAGGPSENGSLRNVRIIRGNKTVAELDFYEFLLKGEQPHDMRLQDQDVIFVSPYTNRVAIAGEVKRNNLFDMKPDETLKDLLYYAGGFTGNSYKQRIKIFRKTGREHSVLDIALEQQGAIRMQNGDSVHIDAVLKRYANRVIVSGAVMRPGIFAIDSVATLKQLIKKADGLREDVFKNRILVFRLQPDFTREVIPIDLGQLMSSNLDFTLQREDSVRIPSVSDLRETYSVTIEGEVARPGVYPFAANTRVEDLVMQAGGLLETASMAHLEIARRIKDNQATSRGSKLAETFQFAITKDLMLSDPATQFILQPFDKVFIRRSPAYTPQLLVSIEGEVAFPGRYSITSRTERISDLILRAGSVTPEAYLKGASLVRQFSAGQRLREKALQTVENIKDSTRESVVRRTKYNTIGVDLEKILKSPGSPNDLILQEGDSLRILKQLQTVQVSGAVYNPNVIPFIKGMRLKRYIGNAGGFTREAVKSNVYVVYGNGSVKKTTRYLFFRHYPRIEQGAEVMVPMKSKVRRGLSLLETVSISTAMSSLALIVITIVNSVK